MIFIHECTSELPVGLAKHGLLDPALSVSDSVIAGIRGEPQMCISIKFPDAADAVTHDYTL